MVFTLSKCHDLGKLQLVSSTNTEKRYICPNCGNRNLKENLRTNAYKCFSEYCSTQDIRTKLGYQTNDRSDYRQPPTSSYVRPVPLQILEPPIVVTEYESPVSRTLGDRIFTNFSYSDSCMVERVDYVSGKKKEVFPKYKSGTTWQYGSSPKFGLFNSRYINSRGSVLIAEGEKTANLITSITNYLTLSPPPFGWSENYISSNLFNPKITSVLYLPDNDKTGYKKSIIIRDACWMVGIPCLIYRYTTPIKDGGDFVDLYNENINIKKLIDETYGQFRTS